MPKTITEQTYLLFKSNLKFLKNKGIQTANNINNVIILNVSGPNSIIRPAPKMQISAKITFNNTNAKPSKLQFSFSDIFLNKFNQSFQTVQAKYRIKKKSVLTFFYHQKNTI